MNLLSWGGAYGNSHLEAYAKPFEAASGVKVVIADADNPGIRTYLEQAIVGSARLFAESGEKERLEDMIARYQQHFAGGQFAAELARLLR